jgi:hypothetical protein
MTLNVRMHCYVMFVPTAWCRNSLDYVVFRH